MKNLRHKTDIRRLSQGLAFFFLLSAHNMAFAIQDIKFFQPNRIITGGTSTLVIQVYMDNAGVADQATSLEIFDDLPDDVFVAPTPNVTISTECGPLAIFAGTTPGSNIIHLTGGTIDFDSICTVTIDVTSNVALEHENLIEAGEINYTFEGVIIPGEAADANLIVAAPVAPTVTKKFAPAEIVPGQPSVLTITLENPNVVGTDTDSLTIMDTLPMGVTVISPSITGACGGTLTTTAGAISLAGGEIANGAKCIITVNVTSTMLGMVNNVATASYALAGQTFNGSGNAPLKVVAPTVPTITKTFAPAEIVPGQPSALTITVTNPNGVPTAPNSLTIMDTLPMNVTVISPLGSTPACGGTLTTTAGAISLAGGEIIEFGECIITVNVTSTTLGTVNNTATASTSIAGQTFNLTVNTPLEVVAPTAPTVTKTFAPPTIVPNQTSILTITVTNPNGVPTATDSLTIMDTLPMGVTVISPLGSTPACGGTLTTTAGAISLAGGEIIEFGECTITVNVTSTTLGTVTNTATASTIIAGETFSGSATAPLEVVAAFSPTVAKTFAPSKISPNQTSVLTITVTNSNSVATVTNSLDITDNLLPTGITVVSPSVTQVCGGTLTTTTNTITLDNGEIAAGGTCTITVNVTSVTPGQVTNAATASFVIGTETLTGTASADLIVVPTPTVDKKFNPDDVDDCGCSTLVITLTNPSSLPATLTTNFVDRLPPGLQTVGYGKTTCPGGSVDIRFSRVTLGAGAVIPANGFCTVSVDVESECNGEFTNRISAGALQTTNGQNLEGATASVNFCCEDIDGDREMCLVQNTYDEEEDISLYIE